MAEKNGDVSMEYSNQFDLSDEEDAEKLDLTPFQVDWIDLSGMGCPSKLGISGLPGCRHKKIWRSLAFDLDCLKEMGVSEVFCLCTEGELYLCRVKNLMEKYAEEGLTTHHYAIEDGHVPEMSDLMKLIEEVRLALMAGRKTLVHCHGDGGRSCVVAICLMMVLDKNLSLEEAKEKVKDLRHKEHATTSVKQYNFVNGFKTTLEDFTEGNNLAETRSLSR